MSENPKQGILCFGGIAQVPQPHHRRFLRITKNRRACLNFSAEMSN